MLKLKCALLLLGLSLYLACEYYQHEQYVMPTVVEHKKIIVVIPSYNNIKWCDGNLASVFDQTYQNYSVIYVDDCSTDGTYDAVLNCVARYKQQDRVTIIRNDQRKGALRNLYEVIHTLPSNVIVVTLDGDDLFANRYALEKINAAYQDKNVWLTYGQYETYPDKALGICHTIPEHIVKGNAYRSYTWVASHPRTFYAELFKQIQKEDLMLNGEFFDVTWDQAMMFPMLEMAAGRIRYIPDILYLYNHVNPLNDFRNKLNRVLECEQIIRSREPYQPLANLSIFNAIT